MRTSTWNEYDRFSKNLDRVIEFFDKAGGNPYHDERGRFASGPGGGAGAKTKPPKQSRPKSVTDETIRRRERARLAALRKQAAVAREEATKALEEIQKHAQDKNALSERVASSIDKAKAAQQNLKDVLKRTGDSVGSLRSAGAWFDLAISAMITSAMVSAAGAIHPVLGGLGVIMQIGYLSYKTYKAIRGID